MGYLWLAALVLVVLGFAVAARARRAGGPPVGPLTSRGIDPRRWGIHVLASGAMLSLGLWVLDAAAWSDQAAAHRVALLLGGAWAATSLGLAVIPLAVRRHRGSPSLPVSKGTRPPRSFLLLGWVIAVWLAWIAVRRMG